MSQRTKRYKIKKRQARGISKILDIIIAKESNEKTIMFRFPEVLYKRPEIAPLVTLNDVTVSSNEICILNHIDFSIYPTTRAGLIGLNGSGKSVLLKLIAGDFNEQWTSSFNISNGHIWKQDNIKVGLFDQHSIDKYANYLDKNPLQYFMDPKIKNSFGSKQNLKIHDLRCFLARFGIKDKMPLRPIGTFSGGEKTRLAMAELAFSKPDILYLTSRPII